MQLLLNLCCQFIITKVKNAVCKFKIVMFLICFAMKMPVYKPEGKLVRIFWLKNELFQSRGYGLIVNVLNPGVILRRFYQISVNFSENSAIFSRLQEKIKSNCFSDLLHHAGHK